MLTVLAETIVTDKSILYGAIASMASVIAWVGRHIFQKLNDCEKDREVLHKKVGKVASVCAARLGEVIDLDDIQ